MTWQLIEGDCVEVMQSMDESSVDAIVTDPLSPYGLEFMGKEWDRLDGGFSKPGIGERDTPWSSYGGDPFAGYNPTCATCGGRARGKRKCSCAEPDWRVKGAQPDGSFGPRQQEWHHAWALEALRVLKPGGHLLSFGGTRTYHRLTCALEDAGFEIRDCLAWLYGSGFPKSLDVSKAIDKAAGAEREVVGHHVQSVQQRKPGVTYGGPGQLDWQHDLTAPATEDAERWQGWGTALKPAFEPIVLARKPLSERNVAANVQRWGVGALNVDGCRIEGEPETPGTTPATPIVTPAHGAMTRAPYVAPAGRWPANVLLDEEWVPVVRTRDNLSDEAWLILQGWLDAHNGEVPDVRSGNRRPAEQGEAEEVLLAGVLRGVAVGEPARVRTPNGGSASLSGVPRPDESEWNGERQGGAGQSQLEGELLVEGLRDGQPAEGQGHPGTPARGRGYVGAGSGPRRDRPSPERRQARQSAREPRGADQEGASDQARSGARRAPRPAGRRREVLLWSVPKAWLSLFEFTGDMARVGAAAALDEQSGELHAPANRGTDRTGRGGIWSAGAGGPAGYSGFTDTGGASRFFYTAKAGRGERERGRMYGAERNAHPTVKPVDLMQWLCRLVTPPKGLVLDPFTGSGSTGIAALREGFDFIGIEKEAEYVEIARARIIGDAPLLNTPIEVTA